MRQFPMAPFVSTESDVIWPVLYCSRHAGLDDSTARCNSMSAPATDQNSDGQELARELPISVSDGLDASEDFSGNCRRTELRRI